MRHIINDDHTCNLKQSNLPETLCQFLFSSHFLAGILLALAWENSTLSPDMASQKWKKKVLATDYYKYATQQDT